MPHLTKLAGLVLAALIHFSAAAGAAPPNPATGLPEVIRAERDAFRPVGDADLNTRRAQLTAAIDRMQRYLTPGGANGQRWARFLRVPDLSAELAKGQNADLTVLEEIQPLYTSGYLGLELPVFTEVGKSLRRYIDALTVVADDEAREHFQARVDALAEGVEQYIQSPIRADTYLIGAVLGEISASGQMPRLLPDVRRRMSFPNVFIEARERLVAAGINDVINDVGPLTDVILGTRIQGTVQTVGFINADLEPSGNYAAIDVLLRGTAYSRSTGYNGPAIIHSSGVTGLGGRKRLILDEYGLRSLPAASNARTRSTIHGVDVNARHFAGLVDKIATKRVYQSKRQAEAVGSRHAESRLNARMDSQSSGMVAQANRDFWSGFRHRLARFAAFPEMLLFSTTHDRMLIRATRADNYQLGAPTAPPDMPAASDVQVRVHESMLNNLGYTLLAGKNLTPDEMKRMAVNLTGREPKGIGEDEDRDWSIYFDYDGLPVETRLIDGGVKITLHGDAYTADGETYDAMDVTARYRLENGPKGLVGFREGELDIVPPGFEEGQQLGARQQSLRRILTRRMSKVFKERLPDEERERERPAGLDLPGRWKSIGPLPLVYWRSEHGWLSLGWNQPEPAPAVGPALIHPASLRY